jgi:hypothetical protein
MRSRFEGKPSQPYKNAMKALYDLKASEKDIHGGIDQAGRAYSDSVHEDLLQTYMKQYDLKFSRVNHRCLCYLIGNKKCSERNEKYYGSNTCVKFDGVCDHTYMFIRHGKPFVFVTQPYNLTEKGMKSIAEVCEANNLVARVGTSSWHYPAGTLLIEVHRNGWQDELASL